jgi:hypothetical protein
MNVNILGKQVQPLPIDRSLISGREADKVNGGMGAWLTGDAAIEHYKKAVDQMKANIDEDYINQNWYVFAICADGTYTLRSEMGYETSGISEKEFIVIKDGNTWGSYKF